MKGGNFRNYIVFLIIALFIGVSVIPFIYALEMKTNVISNDREYYALVVGVNDYTYEDEEFFDQDVVAMYECLSSSKNFEENNIKILLNEDAIKANIQDAIVNWLDSKEDENDVVFIYFSGHGWHVDLINISKGFAYFVPYDSSGFNDTEEQLRDKELDLYLDELESNNTVIILDHCYAGRMLHLRQTGRIILAAGGKYFLCPVDSDEQLGLGIFTFHILQGFKGIADIDNDGWISAEEVFHYAKLPTFWFSFWKHFPFLKFPEGEVELFGPQFPFLYDHIKGKLNIIDYT